MERGRGSVATVLVQKGTLRVGDVFVAGSGMGPRARALIDDRGNKVEEAGPATPVEVLGLAGHAGGRRRFRRGRQRNPRPRSGGLSSAQGSRHQGRGSVPRHAGADVLQDRGRRSQGTARGHQGRRARLGRGDRRRPSRSSAPMRSRCACCIPPSAASTNPTSRWPRLRTRWSSASMCAPTRRPATWPGATASRSATTRSSTMWPTTCARP